MTKKIKFTLGLGIVVMIVAGLMWFISPLWTNLFPGIRQISAQIYPATHNEPVEITDTAAAKESAFSVFVQAVFWWVYVILGAVLTAFAVFVAVVDYIIERKQIKPPFTFPRVLHRH